MPVTEQQILDIQAENFAEDVEILPEMTSWTIKQVEDANLAYKHALAILPPPDAPPREATPAPSFDMMMDRLSAAYAHATDVLAARPPPPPPPPRPPQHRMKPDFVPFTGHGRTLGGRW